MGNPGSLLFSLTVIPVAAARWLPRTLPPVDERHRPTDHPRWLAGPDQGELVVRLAPHGDALAIKDRLERELAGLPGIITRVNEPTSEKLDESFSGLPA